VSLLLHGDSPVTPPKWRYVPGAGFPPPLRLDVATHLTPEESQLEEDFYLRAVQFPILVLPPDHWDGFKMVSGMGSHRDDEISEVGFLYLDSIRNPTRGLGVNSRDPEVARERSELWHEVAALGVDSSSYDDEDETDFIGHFIADYDPARTGGSGPRRYVGRASLSVLGMETPAEHWKYRAYLKLTTVRFLLSGTEISLLGWGIQSSQLLRLGSGLEPLELGSPLFKAMKIANAEAVAAWRQLRSA
jgi:hypothetical protein